MDRAGHETSANTLTFLVSFLALYPEVQEKMLREIESVNGSGWTIASQLTMQASMIAPTCATVSPVYTRLFV